MARLFIEDEVRGIVAEAVAIRRARALGPRLMALVGYQNGACHMLTETIRRFLRISLSNDPSEPHGACLAKV